MERRQFLATSLAAAAAVAGPVQAQLAAVPKSEYYLLRRYNLLSGQQLKITESFLAGALLPAL